MQFIKRNILTLSMLAFVMVVSLCGDAFAATVMELAASKTVNVFTSIKTIIFIVGGFGLIVVAFSAIFGKMKWSWFAGLAVGLGVLAAAGAVVEYATGTTDYTGGKYNFGDSFDKSAPGSL